MHEEQIGAEQIALRALPGRLVDLAREIAAGRAARGDREESSYKKVEENRENYAIIISGVTIFSFIPLMTT